MLRRLDPDIYTEVNEGFDVDLTYSPDAPAAPSIDLKFTVKNVLATMPKYQRLCYDADGKPSETSEEEITYFCEHCRRQMESSGYFKFQRFDTVQDSPTKTYPAYVYGEYRRYRCVNGKCTGKPKSVPSKKYRYRDEPGNKVTRDFRFFIAKTCASYYNLSYERLAKELSKGSLKVSEGLVKSCLNDYVQDLGVLKHCNPMCQKIYIYPITYDGAKYLVLFGVISDDNHDVYTAYSSPDLITHIKAFSMAPPHDFAVLDVVHDNHTGFKDIAQYITFNADLKILYLPKDRPELSDIIQRACSIYPYENTYKVIQYNASKPGVHMDLHYQYLVRGFKTVLCEMEFRHLNYFELRLRLFRQSEYRKQYSNIDIMDSLMLAPWGYGNGKGDDVPPDLLKELLRKNYDVHIPSAFINYDPKKFSFKERIVLAGTFRGYMNSAAHCADQVSEYVPLYNDKICPDDEPPPTQLPASIAISYVSTELLVKDYLNQTMFTEEIE